MEGTYILEGTVMLDKGGKVYLISKQSNQVIDLNLVISDLIGEKVKVVVGKSENL